MTDTTYRVSVVVPTFRRPELLNKCLAALTTQDLDPTCYEILIVDDANSPETRKQVECWSERLREDAGQMPGTSAEEDGLRELPRGHTIRYLPVIHSHGPAAARNLGWRAARGGIIAFTDDDCLPSPCWLKAGVSAFRDGVVGVCGKILVPLSSIPTDYEHNAGRLAYSRFVTANCFYRRSALEAIGGFDERFAVAWREDTDLMFSLLESGAKLLYIPEALVVHPIRPVPWGISLRQQRKSMYNALLYKKHSGLYRQRIQSSPPWHYYCIVSALLIVLVTALSAFWIPAIFALGAWVTLTGRFCVQRLRHTSHMPHHILEMVVTSMAIPPLAIFWRLYGAIRFRVFFF